MGRRRVLSGVCIRLPGGPAHVVQRHVQRAGRRKAGEWKSSMSDRQWRVCVRVGVMTRDVWKSVRLVLRRRHRSDTAQTTVRSRSCSRYATVYDRIATLRLEYGIATERTTLSVGSSHRPHA
jgi:hypothetical protein